MFSRLIKTPVGVLRACWNGDGRLQTCSFVELGQVAGVVDPLWTSDALRLVCQRQQLLEERLRDYFSTGQLQWALEWLDWSAVPPFHGEVLKCCAQIPPGKTFTYAELAARAGSPRAARAVGSAMARNRWPIIIPCHRVVGADGGLTGYSGTGGIETKAKLLGLEAGQMAMTCTP